MFYSASTNGFYDTEIHGDKMPEDVIEITKDEHKALLDGQSKGKVISAKKRKPILLDASDLSNEQIIDKHNEAIKNILDFFAKSRGYNSILDAVSYATSTVAKFKSEGKLAIEMRDAVRNKYEEIMADVNSGARQMPTTDELISELPELSWSPTKQ